MSPQIGVGVLIFRDGKLLLGRRRGSHGSGEWSAPGGHLEFGETPADCAARETAEETGLATGTLCNGPFVSNVFHDVGKHYITLFMCSHHAVGEPELLEVEKCEGWQWFSLNALPTPLFSPLQTLIEDNGVAALEAMSHG